MRWVLLVLSLLVPQSCLFAAESASARKPLEITRIKRTAPVDFDREILPMLKQSCLACHSRTTPKGDLVLESVKEILKGGESGPAVVAKSPSKSPLLQLAAHRQRPIMPPRDNKAGAPNLTPDQLGLIQLWIEQGAREGSGIQAPVVLTALPAGLKAVQSVALDPSGRWIAAGRAGTIAIYDAFFGGDALMLPDPNLKQPLAHQDIVQSLAFSPDGLFLASGSFREVKIWRRLQDDQPQQVGRTSVSRPALLAVHPSTNLIALASADGAIVVQSVGSSAFPRTIAQHGPAIQALAWDRNDLKLTALDGQGRVRVWGLGRNRSLHEIQLPKGIQHAGISPDGSRISGLEAVGSGRLHVWRVDSNRLESVASWPAPKSRLAALRVSSAKSGQLFTLDEEGTASLWESGGEKPSKQFKLQEPPVRFEIFWDTLRLASVSAKSRITILSLKTGSVERQLEVDPDAAITLSEAERQGEFFSADLEVFKAAHTKGKKELEEEEARKKKAGEAQAALLKKVEETRKTATEAKSKSDESRKAWELQSSKAAEAASLATNFVAAGKAAAGKRIPEADWKGFMDRLVRESAAEAKQLNDNWIAASNAWFKADSERQKAEQEKVRGDEEVSLASKAIDRLQQSLLLASNAVDAAEHRRNKATNHVELSRQKSRLPLPEIVALGFDRSGAVIQTASVDGKIRRWRVSDGYSLKNLDCGTNGVRLAGFRGDGTWVSLGEDRFLRTGFQQTSWKLERILTGHQPVGRKGPGGPGISDRVNVLKFSNDGRMLLAGAGEPSRSGELWIWEVPSYQSRPPFTKIHSDAILGLDFSPDGQWLASAGSDRFVRLLSTTNWQVIRSLEGHTHHVMGVAWKADNRTVVSAGADNVLKVWDSTTGERRKNVETFGKEVTAVGFLPWASQFVAASGDGQVILFKDNGETVRVLGKGMDFLYSAVPSRDGRFAVGGGEDGLVRIWDIPTGKELRSFK